MSLWCSFVALNLHTILAVCFFYLASHNEKKTEIGTTHEKVYFILPHNRFISLNKKFSSFCSWIWENKSIFFEYLIIILCDVFAVFCRVYSVHCTELKVKVTTEHTGGEQTPLSLEISQRLFLCVDVAKQSTAAAAEANISLAIAATMKSHIYTTHA